MVFGQVYGLHAEDSEIRYVGMSVNPHKRFKDHIYHAFSSKPNQYPVHRWLKKCVEEGVTVSQVILESYESLPELVQGEIDYIAKLGTHVSVGGLNLTWGGEGVHGLKWSDEAKAAQSARISKTHQSDEVRALISEMTTIAMQNDELRAYISYRAKERFKNPKQVEHARQKAIEQWQRPGFKESRTGWTHSDKTKAKMSMNRKGDTRRSHTRWHVNRDIVNPDCEHCKKDKPDA